MKQVFHKIMSVLMTFVVLSSTMSFTIDMHFCGDTIVDTAIFHKAKTCGMKMQKPTSKTCSNTKKNCCSDKQIAVKGQNSLEQTFDDLSLEQQKFVTSFVTSYINLFEAVDEKIISYEGYLSPLVVRQIYKFDETYLI